MPFFHPWHYSLLPYFEEEEIYDQMEAYIEDQLDQNEDEYDFEQDDDADEAEETEEEEDQEEQEENQNDDVVVLGSSRVSQNEESSSRNFIDNAVEEGRDKRRRTNEEGGATSLSSNRDGIEEGFEDGEWNRSEVDGLFCPICMEAWTGEGEHHLCCLPCGHMYGMSCIKKWIQQHRSSGKCPQCNMKCTLKDVRKLYGPRVVVVDEESQKRIRYLDAKCDSLEKKSADWCKKEAEWLMKKADLQQQVHRLTERTEYLEHLLGDAQCRSYGVVSASGGCQEQAVTGINSSSNFCRQQSCSFALQKELQVDGARLFDIDASGQVLIIARRLSAMGGVHVVTKMSLIPPYESEDITLPQYTKAVRDLCVSTSNSKLTLLASMGKKLSVLSMESNHIVLSYELPAAAWSCSWDRNSSQYVYTGLQSGMLLVFDMRQTSGPVHSLSGLTSNPIHTVHSLSINPTLPPGVRTILTASSVGVSQWNFGAADERPYLISETENQGVCISLAYCPRSDDIVASFRPRVEAMGDMAVSQPSLTPFTGQGVQGSHVHYGRLLQNCYQKFGSVRANVSDIRLPKSAIVGIENQNQTFASGDEVTCGLVLNDLPSFTVAQRLKPHKCPIRDVKFTYASTQSLLSCISDDTFQLFCAKL